MSSTPDDSEYYEENGKHSHEESDRAVDEPTSNGHSARDRSAPEEETEGASGAEEGGLEPEEDLTEEERLRRELDEVKGKLLRKTADFENFRKRMGTVREEARIQGRAEVAEPMLAVLDDLERSVEAARQTEAEGDPGPEFKTLKEGVEMVYQKFRDELARLGVEEIEAEGRPFDESVHEALMQKEASEDVEPGTVVQVLEKGYRMDDRVLRHARVVVAK